MAASRNSRPADRARPAGHRDHDCDRLLAHLADFFAPRLKTAASVCAGFSGGRDSLALLHLLAELRRHLPLQLSALHVHHGLSPHADAWADFCRRVCADLAVPLKVVRVRVEPQGDGLEAAARRQRYAAFADCAAAWLALAHHRDDQAETLLLNLLRGAGAHGLAAMPAERRLTPEVRIVRPLIATGRSELEDWLRARRLAWVEDESNQCSDLRRNFLRNRVLPQLASVFPAPSARLAQSARLFAEQAALADEVAAADAAALRIAGQTLPRASFNALSAPRRANLLRYELRQRGCRPPDARYLEEMLRQLAEADDCAAPRFLIAAGLELLADAGQIFFAAAAPTPPAEVRWRGEPHLAWGKGEIVFSAGIGKGIARRHLAAACTIRCRSGGERLQLHPLRPRRALKKILQESSIAAAERAALPLLWCGEQLLWVGGIGIEARFAAASDEEGVLPLWRGAG